MNETITLLSVPPLLFCNPLIIMAYDKPGSEKSYLLNIMVGTSLGGPLFWLTHGLSGSYKPLYIYCILWYVSGFLLKLKETIQ